MHVVHNVGMTIVKVVCGKRGEASSEDLTCRIALAAEVSHASGGVFFLKVAS